jgi:hypothetical protein
MPLSKRCADGMLSRSPGARLPSSWLSSAIIQRSAVVGEAVGDGDFRRSVCGDGTVEIRSGDAGRAGVVAGVSFFIGCCCEIAPLPAV